jgi:tetratricopeptide (TPR) repeat protein
MGKLAAELEAELLVLGTLQSSGERSRLNLRMVSGRGGEMLNSLSVMGDSAQPLRLEEDLVLRLSGLFGPAASPGGAGTASKVQIPRTRELYARALEFLDNGRLEGNEEAIRLLEEASQGEPGYAPVRAGLAWALLEVGGKETHLGRPDAKAHSSRAVDEARKAVQLDPLLPMAHRALGQALLRTGDLEGARRESQRAVDLDPGDFRAWIALADAHAYGDDLAGRILAREHYSRALELHPANWWANFRQATLLQNDGELAEAVKYADRSRELRPSAEYAHLTAAVCLLWLGDYAEAGRRLDEGIRQAPDSGLLRATQALLDFARKDAVSYRARYVSLAPGWPVDHPVSILLRGLGEGLDGNLPGMEGRFTAFAASSARRSLASLNTGERRTASVNAYHMARALAQMGKAAAAKTLLAEAERLHPGKLKVAAADPLLKSIH